MSSRPRWRCMKFVCHATWVAQDMFVYGVCYRYSWQQKMLCGCQDTLETAYHSEELDMT